NREYVSWLNVIATLKRDCSRRNREGCNTAVEGSENRASVVAECAASSQVPVDCSIAVHIGIPETRQRRPLAEIRPRIISIDCGAAEGCVPNRRDGSCCDRV